MSIQTNRLTNGDGKGMLAGAELGE